MRVDEEAYTIAVHSRGRTAIGHRAAEGHLPHCVFLRSLSTHHATHLDRWGDVLRTVYHFAHTGAVLPRCAD